MHGSVTGTEAHVKRTGVSVDVYLERAKSPDVQTAIPGTEVRERLQNRCCVCRRMLRNPKYALLGIGPICAEKHPELLAALVERQARKENVES